MKDSPVVPYKLYVMALVAFFDAINTDGVSICCVTGVTSAQRKQIHFIMVHFDHFLI